MEIIKEILNVIVSKIPEKTESIWTKKINLDDSINFFDYNESNFKHVANIVLDDEVGKYNKKKRKTLIKFNPVNYLEFKEQAEWIYIFTIDDKIVKIGGSRVSLFNRTQSYLCGHHTIDRGNSGSCSNTNAFIYNTFIHYLQLKYEIQMYGFKLPKIFVDIEILNKKIKIPVQTFHSYESIYLNSFRKKYKKFPYLNYNIDPNYSNVF